MFKDTTFLLNALFFKNTGYEKEKYEYNLNRVKMKRKSMASGSGVEHGLSYQDRGLRTAIAAN